MNVRIVALESGAAGDVLEGRVIRDDGTTRLVGVRKASADPGRWGHVIGFASKPYAINETLYEGPWGESLGPRIVRKVEFGVTAVAGDKVEAGQLVGRGADGKIYAYQMGQEPESWRDRPPML